MDSKQLACEKQRVPKLDALTAANAVVVSLDLNMGSVKVEVGIGSGIISMFAWYTPLFAHHNEIEVAW